jgi:hypothetical protein
MVIFLTVFNGYFFAISIDFRHYFIDFRHFFINSHQFSSFFRRFLSFFIDFHRFSSILVIFYQNSSIFVIFSSNFIDFRPFFPLFPPISAYFSAQFPPAPPRNPPWHAADCPKAAIKSARCRAAAAQRGPHAARGGRRFRARGGGGVDGRHRLRGVWVGDENYTDRCACFWGIYWC